MQNFVCYCKRRCVLGCLFIKLLFLPIYSSQAGGEFGSVCSSVCSLVLEDFAGDAFVAGGIDQIGGVSIVFNDLYGRDIQADGKPLLHTGKVFLG